MREIKPQGIALQRASWHDTTGRPQLVVSALVGFALTQHRHLLTEDVVWQLFSKHTTENSVCDLWMEKPTGELLVWGHAHSLHPTARMQVGIRCGPVSRKLQVSGDRQWQPGLLGWKATNATPFTSMPLVWERSFGGAGCTQCPVGVGFDGLQRLATEQVAPLPNIESIGDLMRTPESLSRPAGVAPVWPTWGTTQNRGTFDKQWLSNGFPGMPRDFDSSMFNLAQPEQRREGFWAGNEPYTLEGLHPTQSQLEGCLPDLQLRCFLARTNGISELPMHLDTVAFFPSQEVGVLIFRGVADNVGVDGRKLVGLMAAAEWNEHPRTLAHYHSEFAARLSSNSPYSFLDEPLMPVAAQVAPAEAGPAPETVAEEARVAVKAAIAVATAAAVLEMPAAPASVEAMDLGLLTPDSTKSGQTEDGEALTKTLEEEREMVLRELSRESFLDEAKAGLEQAIAPMRSLVSAIEKQPDREISDLILELLPQVPAGTAARTEAIQAAGFDWRDWIPPKLAQRSLHPEARAQIAAQLLNWIEEAESVLRGLGDRASNAEGLLEQLQQATASDFSEELNPLAIQQLLNGGNAPQLQRLMESLCSPLDSQQAVQLLRTGIRDWKSHVDGALPTQDTWSELLDPSTLRTWIQSLAGASPSASQEFTQTANPLVAAFRASLSNSLEDALPAGPKKAFAEMAQAWSEEEGIDAEIASALSQAQEVRSTDDLLQMINRLSSAQQQAASADVLEESLLATEFPTAKLGKDTPGPTSTTAQDDLRQLRADAVSEPVFAASTSGGLLRKLVTEQTAAGESLAGRDFAGADLSNLNFEGLDLSGAMLEGANLSGANLRNSKLDGAVFVNADLRQTDLSGAQGTRTNFRNILAEGSVWLGARLHSCELKGANLKHADFQSVDLTSCDFDHANLSHADLSQSQCVRGTWLKARLDDASLSDVHWSDSNLSGAMLDRLVAENSQMHFCNFTDTTGPGASLRGSNLEGSQFLGAHLPDLNASHICAPASSWVQSNLPGANFTAAAISHALLSEANLVGATFERADLQGAVLNASVLSHSNFSQAKLASASLRAANATGAYFVDCDLLGADLNGTVIDGCDFTRSQLHALQLRVTHQPAQHS